MRVTQSGIAYREEIPADLAVIREARHCYSSVPVSAEDRVLDLGAHIGASVRIWADCGAAVLAVEPHPDNYRLLVRNVGHFANVRTLNAAVTPTGAPTLLWLHPKGHSAMHRTARRTGGQRWQSSLLVPGVRLSDLIEMAHPTIIKTDIEWAELDLPEFGALPPTVRCVAAEIHWESSVVPERYEAGRNRGLVFERRLEEQGFRAIWREEKRDRRTPGEPTFAVTGTWTR